MDNTTHQVIKLLIEVGLSPVIAEELSEKIEILYEEKRKQYFRDMASRGGKKGGKRKVLKGIAKLKATDTKGYTKARENYRLAALKREELKRNS